MMGVTGELARFIASTRHGDIPEIVIAEAKMCLLDWLSVTLAGANDPMVESVVQTVELLGGAPQATVIGKGFKTSVVNAALANGMVSHVLDFDDTSVEFLGHPSVTLFPSLLALAEWKRKGGGDMLRAFVIGYEVGCRVALGATPNHYLAGWHGTSTIGTFSSAAGSACLLDLDSQQIAFALGAAGTQAAGLKAVFGTSCKPFHAGKASSNGLLAALLAQKGFTSVDNILEGKQCFWEMFSKDPHPQDALADLGTKWHILNNKYKFHASCYGTHAPIEAALKLKRDHAIDPDSINRIEIIVSGPMLEVAGKTKPQKALEGKFSIPYSVANALLTEDTGINAFTDEKVNDPRVVSLRDRVTLTPSDGLAPFESEVTIHSGDKRYQTKLNILELVLGEEQKKRDILTKFRSLSAPILGDLCIQEIIERVERLEEERSMSDFVALLAGGVQVHQR
jgi:2-methylcitrate dehydratase PrpD